VNGACADSQVSTLLHPIVIGRSEAEPDGNGIGAGTAHPGVDQAERSEA